MGILLGLAAALLWGGGDLLINRLTVRIGTSRALVITQALSLLCWIVLALVMGFPQHATSALWGTAIACGVFHVVGLFLTYRAFEVGTLSIVSPIASSFAIVTALLALTDPKKPSLMACAGAVLLVFGVVVVTKSPTEGKTTLKGVPEALGSALAFGVMFWKIEQITGDLGYAAPLIILKIMTSITAVGAVFLNRRKDQPETEKRADWKEVVLLGFAIAVTDSLAWAAWIKGTETNFTMVVTALASLFSAVTVILAAIFLKERLTRFQLTGVVILLLGILIVSLPS